jgi:hypothetical protein
MSIKLVYLKCRFYAACFGHCDHHYVLQTIQLIEFCAKQQNGDNTTSAEAMKSHFENKSGNNALHKNSDTWGHWGGIVLQAGRSLVRDPLRWMIFFDVLNPSGHTIPWALLNLYQKLVPDAGKCFCGLEHGQCINLTTLPPSVSRLPRQYGILNI